MKISLHIVELLQHHEFFLCIMRNNITSFLDKMDDILPIDMKHSIIMMINKDMNINIIKKRKEKKKKMHIELIKIFSTVYHFGGIRLYRNANDDFMLENNVQNQSIYLYSQRSVISNDNGYETHPENPNPENQIIPIATTNTISQENNEIVLFNGTPNEQRRIKIYVMYI